MHHFAGKSPLNLEGFVPEFHLGLGAQTPSSVLSSKLWVRHCFCLATLTYIRSNANDLVHGPTILYMYNAHCRIQPAEIFLNDVQLSQHAGCRLTGNVWLFILSV